jgi:hypothetical protein
MPTSAKHKIQIPFGQIEYTGTFKEPIIGSFSALHKPIESLLRALKPHGFPLDGVEVRRKEKLVECAVELRRTTPPPITFKVTPARLSITIDNADWSEKDALLGAMNAGVGAVKTHEHAEFESQLMVLAMHVQILETPRKDITEPLLSDIAYQLLAGESEFQGVVLTRKGVSVVIDASNAYANSLFVRLVREHKADTTLVQIAEQLYGDEVHIFEVLNLAGDL